MHSAIQPGGARQALHIVVCVFSRGVLRQVCTQLYFADEATNATDPILMLMTEGRRSTLVAHKQSGAEPAVYRFDIRTQGGNETVFFDI